MESVRLIKPYITFADVQDDFEEIFASGWLTNGKHVDAFADELAAYVGAPHAFLTTSATTALSLCLEVLGVGPGDEVVVSDFSFPASANVIVNRGAHPVFCDVNPHTYNMDPVKLASCLGDRTKAVLFVDALGNPSGILDIQALCAARGIPLIEDAACALGSSIGGRRCGSIAQLTCFSFHPRKLLTTGEGGAIATADPKLAQLIALKLNHGVCLVEGQLDCVMPGHNYRMSELQASMGRIQLRKLDAITGARRTMRRDYIVALSPLGFTPQSVAKDVVYNVQSLVFTVPAGVDRRRLSSLLAKRGIETTLATYSMSATSYYKKTYHNVQPNSEHLMHTAITFPCHSDVDVACVTRAVKQSLSHLQIELR